jgi:nucleoside-diphosphate-sugar epimerase
MLSPLFPSPRFTPCHFPLPKRVAYRRSGFVGQKLTQLLLERFPDVKLITTDIVEPPKYISDESRLRVVKADLGDPAQLTTIFEGETVGGVFALQ